jgi:hypothetical protein
LICAGCAGGQTGEESSLLCVDEPALPLRLDEVSQLGFSANDVLALAQGERRASLRWIQTQGYAYGPESEPGVLTVNVTSLGSARYINVVPNEEYVGPEPTIDLCKPRVEVDVQVSMTSEGGALNEQFTETLRSERAGVVTLNHDLDAAKLGGSFAFTQRAFDNERLYRLSVTNKYTAQTLAGALDAYFEHEQGSDSDDSVSSRNVSVACWQTPLESNCR